MSRFICAWVLALLVAVSSHAAPARSGTVLVLGDSISAAYGIKLEEGWVALLQRRFADEGYGYRVVNASVSGETTSGGLARLPRALELHEPDIVIIELGANDGLRGIPLDLTRGNLERMVGLARQSGAQVLLIGMRIPPNYGPRYTSEFARIFSDVAMEADTAFVPFFLEGVALVPGMMQADGLHPTAKAQPVLLDAAWAQIETLAK